MPSPPIADPPTQTQLGSGLVVVKPSSSGDTPPALPDTLDPHNNEGSTADGKNNHAGDSPRPGMSATEPDPQPNTGQTDPEKPNAPKLPESGNNGIMQPVPIISVLEIGRQTLTALSSGGFAVADTTLQVKGPAVTIQDMPVTLGSSHIIFGSSTLLLPTESADGILTAGGQTFTPFGPGSVLVNGETLSVDGPPATASGTVLSLASSGLVVDSQTFAFPTPAPEPIRGASKIVTFAGGTFTQLGNGAVAFHGMTLDADRPVATISGTVISLALSNVIVGSKTFALLTPAPEALPSTVVIDGTTLTAGGPAVTVSGNTLSLATGSSGPYLAGHASGTSTFSVPVTAGETASMDAEGHLVIDGSNDVGGLGSAIMLGFGPATAAASTTSRATGDGISTNTTSGNTLNSTATGVLGFFTGEGSRSFKSHVLAIVAVTLCIGLVFVQ